MVRFQDALDRAQQFAADRLLEYRRVFIVRDMVGRVSLALNVTDDQLSNRKDLSAELHEQLGAFSPGPDEAVQSREDLLLPDEIFDTPEKIRMQEEPLEIYLVDRLVSNRDWLRSPLVDRPPLPTGVAFSLKGGVGRSTAVAAWAYDLAHKGYKVLAVDLDLEAPGLQSLLLRESSDPLLDRSPDGGVVDWLMEGKVGQADAGLFEDMLGTVELPPGVPGEIQVVPAFGTKTRHYVAKLGRAYLPVLDDKDQELGFAELVLELLEKAAERDEPFDVALLDVRSGLHDIGAAAVTRLSAEAFLFARDDEQTWTAYRHLFDHLRSSPSIHWGMPDEDLRWRLSMVGAQVTMTRPALEHLRDRSYATWQFLYDQEDEASAETPERDDEGMPHWPLPIYSVKELQGATFAEPDQAPPSGVLSLAYDGFLNAAYQRLFHHMGESRE